MRLPRVRFTIRRLMLVVAIVAVCASGERMMARSRDFQRQGTLHAAEEKQRRYVLKVFASNADYFSQEETRCLEKALWTADAAERIWLARAAECRENAKQCRQQLASLREQRDHHQKLKEKYEWAAAHPWQWVGRDSPEPPSPHVAGPISFYDPMPF